MQRGAEDVMQSAGKKRATILLVEDDEFVQDVAFEILERAGFRIVRARNAAEALEAYRHQEERIDLLLSDVVMPGKTGPELGKELRKQQPELKVVFMSGYGDSCPEASMPNAKEVYYLAKPFSVKTLVDKINEAFGQATGRLAVGAG